MSRPHHRAPPPYDRDVGGGAPARDAERARAAYVRAYDAARAADDVDAMVEAALGLAGTQIFGTIAGRVPAFLHEAYTRSAGAQRARIAVAIARVWAYGGDPKRAEAFAAEALADAEARDDPAALAAALDAVLLTRWGPDDLDERLRITIRLEDAVAHVADVEARMNAYLWRLTTALECLDRITVVRQLRALDLLASDTGSARVRFFAESRRAMFSLLSDDVDGARAAAAEANRAGAEAGEADAFAIEHALAGAIARHAGDGATLQAEAPVFDDYAVREGLLSVGAEAAMMWAVAGELDRAAAALRRTAGSSFRDIPRDLDWLLTLASLVEAAVAVRDEPLLAAAVELLEPYVGRGIVNGGAVGFVGVVDDYLAAACDVLGRSEQAQRHAAAAAEAYGRMGAAWWSRRLTDRIGPIVAPRSPGGPAVVHLRPGDAGMWWVGTEGATSPVRDAKGLHYLRLVLGRPGIDIGALELSDAVSGHDGGPGDGDLEVIDRTALAAYKRRLAELDAELDEVREWADAGRIMVLEDERDALLAEVRSATGLGGRTRRVGGTDERARVAVRKAIAAAIERVSAVDPVVGRLLADTVRTGAQCRYDPDPGRPVRWVLTTP